MPYTDTTVSNLIINVLTKNEYDGLTPGENELYLLTDDSNIAAGTGISASTSSGVTTVSLDSAYALTATDISSETTTPKLVSGKVISDAIEAGGGTQISAGTGISTSTSGNTTTVSLDTTRALTTADITTGTDTDSKLVSAKAIHDALPSPITVDQTYDSTSTNPQSGVAVAQAIAGGGGGSGTVTSVGLSNASGETDFTITGSPVTSSGTITIEHANSVTAQSTSGVYPITFDKHGHITAAGTAVTIPPTMTILSYGHSTWNDFINAYNSNTIVYCRASSSSNPASGSQTRMAFMAYVNNATTPTNVEFQYYRSVSSHSDTQQGDQTYVYKLDKSSGWSVTTRENYTKVDTEKGLADTWSSGVIKIKAKLRSETALTNDSAAATETSGRVYPVALDHSGYLAVNVPWESGLPAVTSSDNGKVLQVVNGAWAAVSLPSASGNSF